MRNDCMILSHHGIKGQRWGVRRFQNEDGSLTDAGKKHYNIKKDRKNKKLYTEKTKTKDFVTMAKQKLGQEYVKRALGSFGAMSAMVFIMYVYQRSEKHRAAEYTYDPLSKGPVIVDKDGNIVDKEF